MPVFGGQLGYVVAWCLVAETPLEVAAGEVAVGWVRVRPQRRAAWVGPRGSGLDARLELGGKAPMLATEGATEGGTRHILFTVVLFKCMKRVVCLILYGYWSRGSAVMQGR
jgi:hypothetical protein